MRCKQDCQIQVDRVVVRFHLLCNQKVRDGLVAAIELHKTRGPIVLEIGDVDVIRLELPCFLEMPKGRGMLT